MLKHPLLYTAEDDWVKCSIELIDEFYNNMESILSTRAITSSFVINLDEVGLAEWQDLANVTVVVFINM